MRKMGPNKLKRLNNKLYLLLATRIHRCECCNRWIISPWAECDICDNAHWTSFLLKDNA